MEQDPERDQSVEELRRGLIRDGFTVADQSALSASPRVYACCVVVILVLGLLGYLLWHTKH